MILELWPFSIAVPSHACAGHCSIPAGDDDGSGGDGTGGGGGCGDAAADD